MFTSIWEDIKREYSYGNMVTRIILVNTGFFLLINIAWIILRISNGWDTPPAYYTILHFFSISSSLWHNLTHIWVLITHMFLHEGFFHLFFNMLFLFYFGRIVGDFIGNHRVLPLYLLSGLAGGVIYVLSANLFGYAGGSFALGASAAAMGIGVAAGVLSPNYIFYLPLIGPTKIKYIIAFFVIADLIGMAGNANTGGHFAHLGGALFGGVFVWQLREGRDFSVFVNRLTYSFTLLFKKLIPKAKRKGPYMAYKNPDKKAAQKKQKSKPPKSKKPNASSDTYTHQEKVDVILEKISAQGWESLSEEEKEYLANASKK